VYVKFLAHLSQSDKVSIRVALKMVIFQKSIYFKVLPLKSVPFDEKTLCGKFEQNILIFRGS